MAGRPFNTVPDELVEHAVAARNHFRRLGYAVVAERDELEYPYTPTLVCRREPTCLIVDVVGVIIWEKVDDWVSYGRSSGRDTRVALCIPADVQISQEQERRLRSKGVGVYILEPQAVRELAAPIDLAINVELPQIGRLPQSVRTILGPAYEQFGRGEWRDGFRTACQAFEQEARRHLNAGIRSKRLLYSGTLTSAQINRLTIGGLADAYAKIQNPGSTEAMVEQALRSVNPDRIRAIHHPGRATTERRLRENVGRYMWTLVRVLRRMG
jgi:hypothetical protein